jgi:hypothetical protein
VIDVDGEGFMDLLFTISGFDNSVDLVDVSSGEPKAVPGVHDNGD